MDTAALCKTALFWGSSPEEVEAMLACLGAERRQYAKGEMVCRVGDVISSMGVVLRGSLLIQTDDLWGNTAVLDRVGPGQIFGEAYACALGEPLMVDVVAADGSEVLFLNVERVLNVLQRLRPPQPAGAKPAVHLGPEEPGPLPENFPHLLQNHPGAATVLLVRPGGAQRQQHLYHSL